MKYKLAYLFLPAILMMSSCLPPEIKETEKAVIDGWIDSDGYPVVIFSSSVVPDENNTSIAEKLIRWGVVTISDGDETIIMTGGPTNTVYPPYRYVTYQMKGTPGKTYKITADYKDLHAEASCVMLPPTPIKEVRSFPMEDNDTLRRGELRFITPEDVPAYYYITIRKLGTEDRFMPAMLGTYKALTPNVEVSLPIFHPKNKLPGEDTTQLKPGEDLEIHLCRITEEVFTFWKEYDNAILFGGTQFFSPTQSLQSNITGGYGVWSAQGVSTALLHVE